MWVESCYSCGSNVEYMDSAPSKPSKNPGRQRTTSLATSSPIAVGSPILMSESLSASSAHNHVTPNIPLSSSIGSLPSSNNLIRSKVPAVANGNLKSSGAPLAMSGPLALQQPEEQTDNWDDDFEEGISLSKLQGKYSPFNHPYCHKPQFSRTRVLRCSTRKSLCRRPYPHLLWFLRAKRARQ